MEIEGVMQQDSHAGHQDDHEKLPRTITNGITTDHIDDTTTTDDPDDVKTDGLDRTPSDHNATAAVDSDSPPAAASTSPVHASDRPSTPPPGTNNKKRKLADLQSGSRSRSESRPVSPPWKSFAADGPTQFLDNGKRRSGRVNAPPSATPPRTAKKSAAKSTATKGSALKTAQTPQQPTPVKSKKTRPPAVPKPPKTPPKPSRISARIKNQENSPPQPVKQEDVAPAPEASPQSKRKNGRPSKSTQPEVNQQDDKPASSKLATSPGKSRITLKLKRPQFSFLPRHPSHVIQPPKFQSFDDIIDHYDQKLKDAAIRNTDDDRYEGLERRLPERAEQPPEERAEKEARTRLKILEAAQPGGPLSEEKSSVYLPDDQKQLPPQFSHYDHLWAHGAYLKLLLDREKRSHMETAKRIAHACLVKWRERQPQTEEEKEKQENEWYKLIYRQTVKDIQRKWELVGAEIDRRRATRYDEEQRIERELKMQDMLEKSTTLLDKRRAMLDSEMSAEEDLDDMSEGGSDDDDENGSKSSDQSEEDHRMTSSESEGDDEIDNDPDAELSPEALRRKYSTIPDLPQEDSEDEASEMDVGEDDQDETETPNVAHEDQDLTPAPTDPAQEERDYSQVQLEEVDDALLDDSDESTNMSDDDMSSEEEDDDEDNEEEDEESEGEDGGLLGFFGGRKALAKEPELAGVDESESHDSVQRGDEKVESPDDDVEVKAVKNPEITGQDSDDESGAEEQPVLGPTADAMDVDDTPKISDDTRPEQLNRPQVHVSGEHQSVVPGTAVQNKQHPPELSIDMDIDEARPNELRLRSTSADHNMLSADSHGEDRSSQMSPKDDTTVEPTEAESTTSIDLDDANHIARSNEDTPQPKSTKVKIPSLLRGTLREYQHEGLDWLSKLYANQTNGILADEMGLGKTIQTIALLAHLAEEHHVWGPHLIVVPTSVILNWEMEFKKFLPGFKVLSYYGSVEERAQKRKGWSNPDNWNVVITSYQLILKDLSAIRVPEWHYMILDEAHNIKNFNSQRYQAMIRLKTHARLLLTGTPLQNSIVELWSLLTFLTAGQDGQGMGDLDEFTEWFRRPVDEIFVDGKSKLGNEAQDIVSKLHHSLRPYLLRRLKAHVEKQLPGKYEHTVICRLSKRQRQLYDAFMGLSDTKAKLSSGNMISVSQALMSLRKVCNHPDLFEERPIVTSFAMTKPFSRTRQSVVANFEITHLLLRRKMLAKDLTEHLDLDFLSLNLVSRESRSGYHVKRSRQLRASDVMNKLVREQTEKLSTDAFDGSTFGSILGHQNRVASLDRLSKLRRCAMLTEQRTNFAPVFGTDLVERCTTYTSDRLHRIPPSNMAQHSKWYLDTSSVVHGMVKTTDARAAIMDPLIRKFSCITPNVVADVLTYMAPAGAINTVQSLSSSPEPDAFHEPRIRLSIAFPDKRLLQYDCGKLQRLATLLRDLQSRGSRALIFTQMTSVLDILEQFLNVHGYRYLRLDGSTKIESRQDMMERFNRDTRIDVFILSSRSGGVGMNLTGADAVVFYDLDWNPQMDKQCQDRAHRIGQTRDVHIYKFVSEHTIEVNILRKSNQKRLLDEVVIQEGEFTTDYFNTSGPATADEDLGDEFAGAAVERVFGANVGEANVTKVLEAVEDAEDVAAAHAQQKDLQADDFDFDAPPGANNTQDTSRTSRTPKTSVPPTPTVLETEDVVEQSEVDEDGIRHVDDYMLGYLEWWLKDVKYVPPPDKSRRGRLDKNGRDRSHRPRNR